MGRSKGSRRCVQCGRIHLPGQCALPKTGPREDFVAYQKQQRTEPEARLSPPPGGKRSVPLTRDEQDDTIQPSERAMAAAAKERARIAPLSQHPAFIEPERTAAHHRLPQPISRVAVDFRELSDRFAAVEGRLNLIERTIDALIRVFEEREGIRS